MILNQSKEREGLVDQSCQTLCDPTWDSPGKNTGLPFPPPRDLSEPSIKPGSPILQADSLPSEPPGIKSKVNPLEARVLYDGRVLCTGHVSGNGHVLS